MYFKKFAVQKKNECKLQAFIIGFVKVNVKVRSEVKCDITFGCNVIFRSPIYQYHFLNLANANKGSSTNSDRKNQFQIALYNIIILTFTSIYIIDLEGDVTYFKSLNTPCLKETWFLCLVDLSDFKDFGGCKADFNGLLT